MEVGDKVIQLRYDWGKNPDGGYYTYIILSISGDHPFGGLGLNCLNLNTGQKPLFIPSNTFIELDKFRDSQIEKILK